MKDRVKEIMDSLHMTQQVFAQYIELSPASLSSIFNGRTRPTLNIVEAIKKKIPTINTDWLMFGTGSMYMPTDATSSNDVSSHSEIQEPSLDFDSPDFSTPQENHAASQFHNGVRNTRLEMQSENVKYIDKPQRKITEIRVYFDDLTYETFVPSKNK
ncbi:MAG: helix-turn-helix domain-containing protein [Prevotella sp.]